MKILIEYHEIGQDRSTYHNYEAIEQRCERFTIRFRPLIIVSAAICFLMPFLLAGYTFIIGKYSHDVWFMPLPFV